MLPTRINTKIPQLMKDYVVKLRALLNDPKVTREIAIAFLKEHETKLQKETGLQIYFSIRNILNAAAWGSLFTVGHNSTNNTSIPEVKEYTDRKITSEDLSDFKVDLTQMKFSGKLPKEHKSYMELGLQLFNPRYGFTDEQITAIALHELGHLVSDYLHLGEYVLLNQYLANAIELFQGNAAKVKNVEIYSEAWLRANLTEEELKDFVYGQADEKTAVRVALSAVRKVPRKHITGSNFSATVREEQFADLFASRLGYTRQLAAAMYNLDRQFGAEALKRPISPILSAIGTLFLLPAYLLTLPLITLLAFFEPTPEDHLFARGYRYDNDKERIIKFKRELIFQIRTCTSDVERKVLMEDLKMVEHYVNQYNKVDRTFYEAVRNVVNYSWRKQEQQHHKERVLEQLVNNDIFVKSYKLA